MKGAGGVAPPQATLSSKSSCRNKTHREPPAPRWASVHTNTPFSHLPSAQFPRANQGAKRHPQGS